jgi:hypothetical protein
MSIRALKRFSMARMTWPLLLALIMMPISAARASSSCSGIVDLGRLLAATG